MSLGRRVLAHRAHFARHARSFTLASRPHTRIEPLVALEHVHAPVGAVASALSIAYLFGQSVPPAATASSATPATIESKVLAAIAARDLAVATGLVHTLLDTLPTDQRTSALERCVHAIAAVRPSTSTLHPVIALATVYDHAIDRHILPSPETVSRLVSAFSQSLCADTLVQVLGALAPRVHDAFQCDQPSVGALSAFIVAYGRAQRPDLGEQLLASVAPAPALTCLEAAQRLRHTHAAAVRYLREARAQHTSIRHNKAHVTDVPMHAWTAYTALWNALVRARGEAGDTDGARIWLARFRFVISAAPPGIAVPRRSASPYLTMMHLSTRAGLPGARPAFAREERRSQQQAAVHELLRAMKRDNIMPGVSVFSLVATIDAANGNVARAARILRHALVVPAASHAAAPAHTVRYRAATGSLLAFLSVHAEHASASDGGALDRTRPLFRAFDAPEGPALRTVCSPRAVVRTLKKRAASSATQKVLRVRGTRLLNEALRAAICSRDYALALDVVDMYSALSVLPNAQTSGCVWESLVHVLKGYSVDVLAGAVPMDGTDGALSKERRLLEHMLALQAAHVGCTPAELRRV